MNSLLNIGTRALLANQVALGTTGHNIANANTAGYSRQTAVLSQVPGQYTGNGYIGNGVEVADIERAHSDFLTQQAALAQSVQAMDRTRADRLNALQDIFQGGASGLGAAVSDTLNAFSDVASVPTDLTARNLVLTRTDELATRFQDAQPAAGGPAQRRRHATRGLAPQRECAGRTDRFAQRTGGPHPGPGPQPERPAGPARSGAERIEPAGAGQHDRRERRHAQRVHRQSGAGAGHLGSEGVIDERCGRQRPAVGRARPAGHHDRSGHARRRLGGRPAAIPEHRPHGSERSARAHGAGDRHRTERTAPARRRPERRERS